jgi:hypothetical protein
LGGGAALAASPLRAFAQAPAVITSERSRIRAPTASRSATSPATGRSCGAGPTARRA